MRIGYLTSHPIQYQAPLFRKLGGRPGIDLTVFYCHDHGVRPSFDKGFGQQVRYDVELTSGFAHRFMRNISPRPSLGFWGQVNPEIAEIIRKGEFDAVIVHGYAALTNLAALLAPRSRRTRIIMRGESHLNQPRRTSALAAKQVVLRLLLKRVDHVLAIGSLNARYWQHYGVPAQRITIAPYTVDNEFFAERAALARESNARAVLGVSARGPVFLFCGKLIPVKRPLDAVRALAIARRAGPCTLAIAGDGPMRHDVLREVAELGLSNDVLFLGFRNQSELPGVYAAADALVLPSDSEPWGLVVNEAMAAGLAPAVSDRVGSGPDLVEGVGAVFPVGEVEKLGAIMSEWVRRPELLEAAKARARERIAKWGFAQTVDGIVAGVEAAVGR